MNSHTLPIARSVSHCRRPSNPHARSLFGAVACAILLFIGSVAQATIPATERAYLVALYNQTNGASWVNKSGWLGSVGTECAWHGITCDASGEHVRFIKLGNNGLNGTLPPNLNDLTELFLFDVSRNALSGTLPAIAAMTALSQFYAHKNDFSGLIPALAATIVRFDVSDNLLTGILPTLPAAIERFYASNNVLSGSIPALSGLTSLAEFVVHNNQLVGSLPSLLGTPNIERFEASDNKLTGSIPVFINAPKLARYSVAYNELTGGVPPLSGVPNLDTFRVESNQLNGFLPGLAGLLSLSHFTAHGNSFTGTIPTINHIASLQVFNVSLNQLIGPIPNLEGLTNLNSLNLGHNQLTGGIPSLAGLSSLTSLILPFNQLTGSIPSLSGSPLQTLQLHGNQLSGTLPGAPSTLLPDGAIVCPNQLTPAVDSAWDAAVAGAGSWFAECTSVRLAQSLTVPNVVSLSASYWTFAVGVSPSPGSSQAIVAQDLTPTICTGSVNAGTSSLAVQIPATTRVGSICRIAINKAGDATYNSAPQVMFTTLVTRQVDANACRLDADGDGRLIPGRDGVLLMRYLMGFRDSALTQGLLLPAGLRKTGSEIASYLDGFNFNVNNAAAAPAETRTMRNAIVIQRYFQSLTPLLMVDKTGVGTSGFVVLNNIEAWCPSI